MELRKSFHLQILLLVRILLLSVIGYAACGIPSAMTLGPKTTVYFQPPTLSTLAHEKVHRLRMAEVGQTRFLWRYLTSREFRIQEESLAMAAQTCEYLSRYPDSSWTAGSHLSNAFYLSGMTAEESRKKVTSVMEEFGCEFLLEYVR